MNISKRWILFYRNEIQYYSICFVFLGPIVKYIYTNQPLGCLCFSPVFLSVLFFFSNELLGSETRIVFQNIQPDMCPLLSLQLAPLDCPAAHQEQQLLDRLAAKTAKLGKDEAILKRFEAVLLLGVQKTWTRPHLLHYTRPKPRLHYNKARRPI